MKLIDYMPFYYKKVQEIVHLQEAIGLEYESTKDKIIDAFKQCYIYTATWGIQIWEELYGIPKGDTKTNLEDRRELVISKMRSEGATTVGKLKNIALSFTNGEIDVEEVNSEYYINIRFTSIVGKVPNLKNFEKAVRLALPAHLGYKLIFRYNTHGEIAQHKLTHEQLKRYTHQQIYDTRIFYD